MVAPGQHGAVSPGVFIPVAEETGQIVSLGAWLLGEACHEAAAWPVPWHVAVNVSPVQFRVDGFVDSVRSALVQSGLDAQRLELEITEGILLSDTSATCRNFVLTKSRSIVPSYATSTSMTRRRRSCAP